MGRKQALRRAEMKSTVLPRVEEAFNAIKAEFQKEVVQNTLDIDWRAWIVALNDEHGHGRKRLARTLQKVNRIYSEYNRAQTEGDLEYAEAILDRRVLQIMGEDFFLQSKEGDV